MERDLGGECGLCRFILPCALLLLSFQFIQIIVFNLFNVRSIQVEVLVSVKVLLLSYEGTNGRVVQRIDLHVPWLTSSTRLRLVLGNNVVVSRDVV